MLVGGEWGLGGGAPWGRELALHLAHLDRKVLDGVALCVGEVPREGEAVAAEGDGGGGVGLAGGCSERGYTLRSAPGPAAVAVDGLNPEAVRRGRRQVRDDDVACVGAVGEKGS